MRGGAVRGSALAVGLVLAGWGGVAEAASDGVRGVGGGKPAMGVVPLACHDEITRFCPAADTENVDARGAYICLRPYRTSASTGCRRAIDAASKQGGG